MFVNNKSQEKYPVCDGKQRSRAELSLICWTLGLATTYKLSLWQSVSIHPSVWGKFWVTKSLNKILTKSTKKKWIKYNKKGLKKVKIYNKKKHQKTKK